MGNNSTSDTILCRLKFSGLRSCKLDDDSNLIYVGSIISPIVVLPYGIKGLRGTGLSGLDFEVLKFNKDLVNLELCSLSNCSKFKELYVYEHQLSLISDIHKMYSDLQVFIRKGVV